MLELIIGRAGTGKTFRCLDQLKHLIRSAPLERQYLLVPAYMTYKLERELAEMTGGSLNTYVLSFQRFAQQTLNELGGAITPRISDIGRRLLLKKILIDRNKRDQLKYFAKAAKQRGFSETLAEQLKELRSYSIDADRLRELTFEADDELADKIIDLALLADDFKRLIEGQKNDDSDVLELATEMIAQSDEIKNADVFIDGFIFFDPQQRNMIEALLKSARNVHITLTMDVEPSSLENRRELGMFHRAYQTFSMLKKLSSELSIDVKVSRLENSFRFKNKALALIEENLFKFPPSNTKLEGDIEGVKVVEAASRRVEVEMLARDIRRLIERKNYRPREIGVLLRDDSYADLIKPVFEKHGINYFNDAKRAGAHHPLAELIRSALEMQNWRSDAIFRCLRTGFFNVERDDVDLLENYALEFGVRGKKKWTQDEPWTWHRREVDDDLDNQAQWQQERSAKADEIRRRLIEPLIVFSDQLRDAKTMTRRAEVLYGLLERLNVYDTLSAWSNAALEAGDPALSREHLKIWDDVTTMLEQFAEALGDEPIALKEFEALVNEGLDSLKVSLIPPGLDEVTVAQFDQNSLQNARAIYILGFSDGLMPRRSTEKGLFTDADRLHLRDLGLEISLGGLESSLAEKFLLYRGLTEVREYLYLSYPLADAEGKAMKASSLLERIMKFMPSLDKEFAPIDVLSPEEQRELVAGEMKLKPSTAKQLFTRWSKLSGSVSRFEKFMACPFKHFAQYGLRLEERREWKFQPPDVGNILHAILKKFGERMQFEHRRWGDVGDDEMRSIVNELLDEVAPRLRNQLMKSTRAYEYQLERIRRLSTESLRRLTELDRKLETSFGRKGELQLKYDLDGTTLELNGRIDRIDVDEAGNYFLIMDYKTGSNVSLNAVDFYFGLNLQLLTYLLASSDLLRAESMKPAGMFYFLLRYPTKTIAEEMSEEEARSELEKDLRMIGMMLKDKAVVDEIDSTQKFIRARFTNDGKFYRTTNAKTADEFEHLIGYVRSIFKRIGAKMLDGEISARPFKKDDAHNGCMYCEFKAMCGFEPDSRNWLFVPNWDDEDALKKIEETVENTAEPLQTVYRPRNASAPVNERRLEDLFDDEEPDEDEIYISVEESVAVGESTGAKKLRDLQRAARLTKGTDDIVGSVEEVLDRERK